MPYVITKENKKKKGPYSLLTLKKKKRKGVRKRPLFIATVQDNVESPPVEETPPPADRR